MLKFGNFFQNYITFSIINFNLILYCIRIFIYKTAYIYCQIFLHYIYVIVVVPQFVNLDTDDHQIKGEPIKSLNLKFNQINFIAVKYNCPSVGENKIVLQLASYYLIRSDEFSRTFSNVWGRTLTMALQMLAFKCSIGSGLPI